MKKILTAITSFFSNKKCVFCFGLLIALIATTVEVLRHRNTNYFDYYDSTVMFWEGISSYTMEYAETFHIYFLYSPVFSVLFSPIFLLPWWLGPFVWNITNYCLFFLSVWTLPERFKPYRLKIFLFLLPVLLQAIFCYQYNTVVCYIFIFAFSLLERGKGFWAVLLIMISACTKVYGIVELALLLCYPKMWRNFGYAIICGIGLLALPALFKDPETALILYQSMFEQVSNHAGDSDFVGILYARGLKPLLLPNSRLVQMSVIGILGIVFFCLKNRWNDLRFKVHALAILMGYIILFSDCPETHTYLIALSGYMLTFWLQDERRWYHWFIFWLLFINFGVLPTDVLCPAWLHEFIHETFWLDVYTYTLAWLLIIWNAVKPSWRPLKPLMIIGLICCLPTSVFAQTDVAEESDARTFTANGVSFTMRQVKAGCFKMGADKTDTLADKDEFPQHDVTLSDYYLGETEVTQELWFAVMGGKNRMKFKGEQKPAIQITWLQCQEFISKLNALTGQHFRMPTEAEWEYAAKGGQYAKASAYSGSSDINAVAWFKENAHGLNERGTHDVATKQPNDLGLYDMTGNVWEWCSDLYGIYQPETQTNPKGPNHGRLHIIRGGGWRAAANNCRTTNRFVCADWRFEDNIGLRLAL